MACAVHTTVPAGQGYTTVEFKLNLVRPIMPDTGPLRAEGKVINAGRTIATSEGTAGGCEREALRARHGDVPDLPALEMQSPHEPSRAGHVGDASYAVCFAASSFCSSPDWYISRRMSEPPTNSPLT